MIRRFLSRGLLPSLLCAQSLPASGATAPATPTMPPLPMEFVHESVVSVDVPVDIGLTPRGASSVPHDHRGTFSAFRSPPS